ncbi:polysaccharide biosynthesis protein [Lacticaseibacillus parahuelsenbergensis]|uniref:Polysaccharide biosynthesis protein n=1 Tax=Lacticaseibacillus parahuelsenbergensis TaxID=3068305 RepID=A0ABY9L3H7_9LACO|nr:MULTISPECIES: polysaccharide biosynthesis protein [Lacticaseibacillus]MDE3281324.1 polysaccharide biosynthesis protein [Lacticaseibacillus casei]WLV78249.1 polysaccharide biosynthesis protein [Lacticaseibacillus sp. NCIMB 15471]
MRLTPSDDSKVLVTGSAWMTVGSIVSRIMGAVYVIPWGIWLGSSFFLANSLFAKGYNIYSLFIIVSTAGIPSALSKQIAHYDAIGESDTSHQLLKDSLLVMSLLGLLSSIIMWLAAPVFAWQNNQVDLRMVSVIHALCWPLAIIPPISIFRGYFQGRSQMGPSAISQLIEQIARIGYLLMATYIIMNIQHGGYVRAVSQSTFAAFIGAMCALIYLVFKFKKQDDFSLHETSIEKSKYQRKEALLELLRQSLPFVVLDSAVVLFQFIDQYTFPVIMHQFHSATNAEINFLYGLFGFNSNKLTMIVISLSTAMASTAIPLLSRTFAKKNFANLSIKIQSALKLFFFVMLPGAVGMLSLAEPLNIVFYRSADHLGVNLLKVNSLIAVVVGLFILLVSIMQAVRHSKQAIFYFLVGLTFKAIFQVASVGIFQAYGPLIATCAGFAVSSILMTRRLKIDFQINLHNLIKFVIGISLLVVIMASVVRLSSYFCYQLFEVSARSSLVVLFMGAIIGTLTYGALSLKTRAADAAFGFSLDTLRNRLRVKLRIF